MDKDQVLAQQVEQGSEFRKEDPDYDTDVDAVQHVHLKTLCLLLAVVSAYFSQVFHIVGAGFLARQVTAVVGGADKATWLANAMTIMCAALGPPMSQAADFWGRKWLVVSLQTGACVGCIIVSRADSIGMVIAGQVVGGLGQGAQPLLHAISSEILPRKYRPWAQAAINVAGAAGGFVGLLVGGALTANNPEGFRTYWYITAGFYAFTTLVICFLYNPAVRELQVSLTTREKLGKLDWIGYVLLIFGLVLFSMGLTWSLNPFSWKDAHVFATFVVGVVLLIAFAVWEWKGTTTGIFHHGLFSKGRNFGIAILGIFIEGVMFLASNNYYGFELSAIYSFTQFKAGLYYTVAWYTAVISTLTVGAYCSRTKTVRLPIALAFVSFTIYNALMASLNASTRVNAAGYSVFMGIGLGACLNGLVVVSQLSTPPELISTTTGCMIATRSLGGTVGLAIYTSIFNSTLSKNLPAKVAAAVLPLGLSPKYLGALIGALTTSNTALLAKIPNVTPKLLEAAGLAIQQSYILSFRYVWCAAAAFSATAVIITSMLIDPKKEFNNHIDAPIETAEELKRPAITEKIHVHV